jgi:hypothetical protein
MPCGLAARLFAAAAAQGTVSAGYSPASRTPPPRSAGTLDGPLDLRPCRPARRTPPRFRGAPDVRLAARRRRSGGSPASPALSPRPLARTRSVEEGATRAFLNGVRSSGPPNALHRFARSRSRTARFGPGGPPVAPRTRGAAESVPSAALQSPAAARALGSASRLPPCSVAPMPPAEPRGPPSGLCAAWFAGLWRAPNCRRCRQPGTP